MFVAHLLRIPKVVEGRKATTLRCLHLHRLNLTLPMRHDRLVEDAMRADVQYLSILS